MPTQVQFRRGTSTQNNAFTGAAGELSVDTTLTTLRVHDGSTAGGVALVNLSSAQTLTNKTITSPSIGTSLTTASSSFDLLNTTATTLNFAGAATALTIGATTGTTTIRNALTVTGNLTVNGTTTTVNSTTVEIQNAFVFEGATADAFETTLQATDPTADRTILLPNASDTLVGKATTDTLTNKTLTFPVIDNIKLGYTTTATAAGTTTLTSASNHYQRFTGSTTQTVVLPVTSTLVAGVAYEIENASTGNLTVNSSGGNLVVTIIPGVSVQCMCIGTSLTTAADWDPEYNEFATITGTGAVVLGTAPTISNLTLSGTLTAGGGVGTNGQLLASTGSGVQWTTPAFATTGKAIAMAMVFGG